MATIRATAVKRVYSGMPTLIIAHHFPQKNHNDPHPWEKEPLFYG
jgi:hypothetical protein